MSRLEKSLKNAKYIFWGLAASYVATFLSRKIFLHFLDPRYLGLDALFFNLTTLLSLSELGIGTAIAYSLYKPLAFNEVDKIKSLMRFYKRAYRTIGVFVLLLGTALMPVLPHILGELPDLPHVNLIYFIYIFHASMSFVISHRRTLLIADQKRYLDSLYQYGFLTAKHIIQMAVIVFSQNFIYFLFVMVIITFIENILLRRKIENIYPYLLEKDVEPIGQLESTQLKKNIYAISLQRVGTFLVDGTDNILIVTFVDLLSAALYSNYVLIREAVFRVFDIIYSSIRASIGNLFASESLEESKRAFFQLHFVSTWLFGWAAICIYFISTPFISLWLGPAFLLPKATVLVIAINFYLRGIRQPVLTFRDSLGLFWYDRYKSFAEAFVNLVVSIILVKRIGFIGVILGTSISTLTVCSWLEPYILFRFGFKEGMNIYIKKSLMYFLWTSIAWGLCAALLATVKITNLLGLLAFRSVVCLILPNLLFYAVFMRTEEFRRSVEVGKEIIQKRIARSS